MNRLENIIYLAGKKIIGIAEFSGFVVILFLKSIYHSKNAFSKRREIVKQMYNAAVRTFLVVSIVALFTGMILTLQGGIELQEFHMEAKIGNLVIATLTREMGPFMSAIIIIAAVGSSMAAEIGTMKVSEEIDALEIMSISPIKFLVMPRVIALSIMLPIVTVYTNTLGALGGSLIAKSHFNISYSEFYHHIIESLHFKAVYVGLFKAFIFGICISCICTAHGLKAENGASGVGRATRNSVVVSFLIILVVGYIITEIFFRDGL